MNLCLKNIFFIIPVQAVETEKAVKALQDANEGAVAINICRIISYKTFLTD